MHAILFHKKYVPAHFFDFSGRKDFKDEIHVMASTLSREMELMETQLNRCMEVAREAVSLREDANSLKSLLKIKVYFERFSTYLTSSIISTFFPIISIA